MPSPSQDTIICSCPSCGNNFAVQTSFLGRQVTCPVCLSSITAISQEDSVPMEKEPMVAAPTTANPPVPAEELPTDVTTSTDFTEPVSDFTPADQRPIAPKKKIDKRTISVRGSSTSIPSQPTTKIRKRQEETDTPAIEASHSVSLAQQEPEYQPLASETERTKRQSRLIWPFVSGLVFLFLSVFIFLKAWKLEEQGSKIMNISDLFVDHEALFSQEMDDAEKAELQRKAHQYALSHDSDKIDREAAAIAAHVTAAMNELALYCMANSDEERLNYVINPDDIAPKMAHWAAYGLYKDFLPQEPNRRSKDGDLLQISVLMDDNTIHPAVFLYDHDSRKWKLDWEAWEGYSPILPAELETQRPSSPVPVRVAVSIAGNYAHPFLRESSSESYHNTAYLNFSLEFPNGERLNAYVDRYSPLALELTRLLYNGPVRACLLIHYPKDLPECQSVIIDKLLYSGWMSDVTRKMRSEKN